MTDQNTFMETVRNVADIVRTSAEPMPEEEILAYFEDMELTDEQKRLVIEYLMNPESGAEDESRENKKNDGGEEASGEHHFTQSKVYKMYLEEISLLPEYTQEETEDLYRRLLQGEENVIETISSVWLKKVLVIAEKYLMQGLHVEDLVQEGNMALFLKLKELCGTKTAVDVGNLLEQAVEEGIMLYASEMNGERELENTILGKMSLIHEAKKILREEKGHDPTMAELSGYTKIPEEELIDLEDILSPAKG